MNNRLRELRMDKSWSQVEFAKKFNDYVKKDGPFKPHDKTGKIKQITYSTVSRWENGSVTIPTIYLDSLADFFGVTVSYLLGLSSRKQIKNRIREVRKARGLRLEEVGKAIGFQGNTICRYENSDREPSAKTEHQDEKKEFLKLENEKDTLDDAIGFLNELISTSEGLTNTGKSELTKVARVLYNIYYDDTHAYWKSK